MYHRKYRSREWELAPYESNRVLWFLGSLDKVLEDGIDLDCLMRLPLFQLLHLARQILMRRKQLAQPYERPGDQNIHGNRTLARQDGREHRHAVFRERERCTLRISAGT